MSNGRFSSFSQFFVPNGSGVLAADDLTGAAVHGEFVCVRQCSLRRVLAAISTLVAADTTAPVVAFKKRVKIGDATGEVTIASLTLPEAAAVGEVYYKDPSSRVIFEPGQVLAIEVTTAATDSGVAAGGALYGMEVVDHPEQASEQSNMVESA